MRCFIGRIFFRRFTMKQIPGAKPNEKEELPKISLTIDTITFFEKKVNLFFRRIPSKEKFFPSKVLFVIKKFFPYKILFMKKFF